jgi:phosphoglucosamine mutase
VIPVGVSPDGFNINKDCGSTHPQVMCDTVVEKGAHLGIALDGDADRLVMCDELGKLINGDQLMAMIASYWHKKGLMKGRGLVATDMSNLGLERYLGTLGLQLHRTRVGDRYVSEAMRAHGYNVGGEQSGHIILSDYSTTGDGLVAALQILAVLLESKQKMSEASHRFTPLPQILHNVRYGGGLPLEHKTVKEAIKSAESRLGDKGRILVRKSGTESLIRIMAEGEDEVEIRLLVDGIAEAVDKVPLHG